MDNRDLGYLILEGTVPEQYIEKPKFIDVSKDDVVIEAILQEADAPNRNKRKYTKKAIESGINNPMFQEKLKNKNLFGEPNHPLSDSIERQTRIDQTRMSHIITKVWWEGNLLKGEIAAANTACGQDFAALVRQGCKMGFSMRGLGGVVRKENDLTIVQDPLLIITYDNVLYPSHPNAYQTKVLKEDFNIIKENNYILNEGVMIPCNYKESIKQYIMSESKQIKDAVNHLELDDSTATLADDGKLSISIKTEEGRMILFAEDAIKKEINQFLRKL